MADDFGATAIEYGLIAAGISVVIIGGVQLVGENLESTLNTIAEEMAPEGGGE